MKRENKYKKALETLRKAQKYEQNKKKIEAFEKYLKMMEDYIDGELNEYDLVDETKRIYYDFKEGDSQ